MPSGHPDFWTATIPGLPAIGTGQVDWYQSDTAEVGAEGNEDLINYVVPDDKELHVCSGVVTCGFPRTQRYDLRQTPSGTWVSPTSHIDPDGKWSYEEYAYDGNVATRATVEEVGHYLELLLSTPTNCDKIRLYASTHLEPTGPFSEDPDIDIDVYYDGAWHNIFSGTITKMTWVEKPIGAVKLVHKARVKWNVLAETFLALYEFQFDTTAVTPQEGTYFDTLTFIPYSSTSPYIVPAGATFVVRVYNDDDAPQDMAVSLAGFLQSKV